MATFLRIDNEEFFNFDHVRKFLINNSSDADQEFFIEILFQDGTTSTIKFETESLRDIAFQTLKLNIDFIDINTKKIDDIAAW
ncbi:hypothetical protein [Arundinibacter roseus]|uniref:Uncharacterized protein n=1 Tax=Arundinibacter roseus TaxID=2070510 RepID=A0A4R4KGE4_9BACT|nr:hypothetical protein [Arundinibacter roseus]TDB67114.1 hypothetical protein EZE20_08345 [Arundinibacter roseus]